VKGTATIGGLAGLCLALLGLPASAEALVAGTPALERAAAAPTTGRLLVTLRPGAAGGRARAAATGVAVARAAGARPAGHAVPQIRLVTVRPAPGRSLRALARRLRDDPRVQRVEVEGRGAPRYVPNDPSLLLPETAEHAPPGTTLQWWAARSTRGHGAVVAVIDTGVWAGHPELADRIKASVSFDAPGTSAAVDRVGHGTHVASLACGRGDNAIGLAGAGLGCSVLAIRSDFTDSSVAAAIVWAVDQGAHAINMSFGTPPGSHVTTPVVNAIQYAVENDVVLVAAAADDPVTDQGHPANVLQPSGSGPDIDAGLGLSVTAAAFDDRRARFAGLGSQISLAAYGAFEPGADVDDAPPGIFGAFTADENDFERGVGGRPCSCRAILGDDPRYGYLQGTSMAAAMVSATAALMRRLNPDLSAGEVLRIVKRTARRPSGEWTADLGWGILDAGAALVAARDTDSTAPVTSMRALRPRTAQTTLTLRWNIADTGPAGVASSGVAGVEVWRSANRRPARRIAFLPPGVRSTRQKLRRGSRYTYYTVGIDAAGNREAVPARPDASVTVVRRPRR
jgi:serine protease